MFDHGNDSTWFAVASIFMFLAAAADILVTRAGIWYHGLTEGNRLFRKILPLKLYKFIFNTAAGSFFVDGAFKFLLTILFVRLTDSIGYADNAHSYLPFAIAAGLGAVVVRNELKIRKTPVTATIGQVS